MSPQILTANHLAQGEVVFLAAEGEWVTDITQARIAADEESAKALEEIGTRDVARNLVVEPYLIDVEDRSGELVPSRNRERIRAQGPTVHPDFQR